MATMCRCVRVTCGWRATKNLAAGPVNLTHLGQMTRCVPDAFRALPSCHAATGPRLTAGILQYSAAPYEALPRCNCELGGGTYL